MPTIPRLQPLREVKQSDNVILDMVPFGSCQENEICQQDPYLHLAMEHRYTNSTRQHIPATFVYSKKHSSFRHHNGTKSMQSSARLPQSSSLFLCNAFSMLHRPFKLIPLCFYLLCDHDSICLWNVTAINRVVITLQH